MLKSNRLLGVKITNEPIEEILEYVYRRLDTAEKKLFIVTPNPEILVYADKNPEYKKILNEADLSLPDGIGVFLASGLLGAPLKERIPGVDFMEELCRSSREKAVSIGLLGGKQGIAKRTAECLKEKYPWIKVAFSAAEWPDSLFDLPFDKKVEKGSTAAEVFEELFDMPVSYKEKGRLEQRKASSLDILFVAYGFPKQEEWIYKHLEKLPVKAAMGVGGAFDYISGDVVRAPYLIRAMGFEWLFRLIRQPWRIKRQLALLEFIRLVFKQRFNK
jgi:N-acetylglucosaminyldiphosphoundecaprenol N-acetyl-beta-D-mannosaminyltransferase